MVMGFFSYRFFVFMMYLLLYMFFVVIVIRLRNGKSLDVYYNIQIVKNISELYLDIKMY